MAVYRRRFQRGARRFSLKKKARTPSTLVSKWGRDSTEGITIPRSIFGFPGSLTTVIRYNDTYKITLSSSTVNGNIMRMNSVFDPDYSGIGHQALYFDQFSAVYDNYVVLGSNISASYGVVNAGVGPFVVGITSANQVGFSSSQYTLSEQNKSTTALLGISAGTSIKTLRMNYDPVTCLGVTADDDTVQSSVSSNPTKQWYAYAWVQDQSLTGGTFIVNVTVIYRVRFFGMKNITSS